MTGPLSLPTAVLAFVLAAVATYAAIVQLRPLLRRHALARPNARSSHREPTPQGGGIAVVGVTLALMVLVPVLSHDITSGAAWWLASVVAATLLLAITGTIDDMRGLAPAPRFALQIVAVVMMLSALPSELRIVPALPWWIERAALLIAAVWFVNLVNFMDGLDWMTVAEVVPICAGLAIIGALGALPPLGVLTAIVLGGAMIGFAPFNRPVAVLFLGDVGSVPIGLILAWLLLLLALGGHVAAALLLPLYYLADATITLAWRLAHGARVWEAHRSHFYQVATDRGFTVGRIVTHVAMVNVALLLLALATVTSPTATTNVIALAFGIVLVGTLLWRFASGRRH
jgi:UDP-N-acetylmuramyl pentapeptide phosphotransferase/UDP-N-acetylglucosamine-1-phosphate transferase